MGRVPYPGCARPLIDVAAPTVISFATGRRLGQRPQLWVVRCAGERINGVVEAVAVDRPASSGPS